MHSIIRLLAIEHFGAKLAQFVAHAWHFGDYFLVAEELLVVDLDLVDRVTVQIYVDIMLLMELHEVIPTGRRLWRLVVQK